MTETMKFVLIVLSQKGAFWLDTVNFKLVDWFEVMQALQFFKGEEVEEKEVTTDHPEREKGIQEGAYLVVRSMLAVSSIVLPKEFPS